MKCPRCGHDILDPDPSFCPRCGSVIAEGAHAPPPVEAHAAQGEGRSPPLPAKDPAAGYSVAAKYYLLALLAVVGGVVGYRAVRARNPRVGATILTIGLLVSVVYVGAGYELYTRSSGPPGTYGLAIVSVGFPNSTSVTVSVANQGTLEDGLESVAINNGTLWLVYGLVSPTSPQASSELQSGDLVFTLYGYILANGTIRSVPSVSSTVGTEYLLPAHSDQVTVPFGWLPLTTYKVFIATASQHPANFVATSPA
ncbi:MAG: zinc ribbon domain-containing protein [Nitrososphaerales archaeon]